LVLFVILGSVLTIKLFFDVGLSLGEKSLISYQICIIG